MVLTMIAVLACPQQADAQIGSDRYAAIVQDARTGTTLMAANADEYRHPASLTKMMTLYMLFEALRTGRVRLDTPITMSREAAAQPPSKLGIPAGSSLTVEEAILALVTRSANDVACAIGEMLAGDEERFAQVMTQRARSLGMTRTTFRNASGLPDFEQVTTARDMALLGRRLRDDFPTYYHYFSADVFRFRGRVIANHNRLLAEYDGTDGIKTGYVHDSGFNLVTSVQRDGQRLVAAVFGGATSRERDRHMMEILDAGFSRLGIGPREVPMAAARPSFGLVPSARADTLPVESAARRGRGAEFVAASRYSGRRPEPVVSRRPGARGPVADRRVTVRDELGQRGSAASRSALARSGGPALRAPLRQTASRNAARIEQGDREPQRRTVARR
ncbi:D-alanyl-D-alanine carboxypeptidase [Roseomonas arctica]|uniref:D-alanyl-D-alanine carboxypeptidase n=2 Tax=Plastoroseomonas arctica TaxID=1509237 RepID=A0AAF1K745_9PROT|nr:D-alanyl-D-alanine carboxypeptidase [Plastoroseomonas arctica]